MRQHQHHPTHHPECLTNTSAEPTTTTRTSKSTYPPYHPSYIANTIPHRFNLPPDLHATSLPVGKARTFSSAPRAKKRKTGHVEGYGADDTPKAFARLMAFSKGVKPKRSGLDDGAVKTKKARKLEQQQQKDAATVGEASKPQENEPPKKDELRIQPGESLSSFRARVDAALPLSGITKSTKKIPGAPDHRVTKHERKLKRLQKGWREEEARIRDKEAEERELAEEEQDEEAVMWEDRNAEVQASLGGKKAKKGRKKRKMVAGEVDNGSGDEFEALGRKRGERRGLHDVVSAPPTFTKVPREIFKVRDVKKDVLGLKKREELGEERMGVVERYRELMARKRGQTST